MAAGAALGQAAAARLGQHVLAAGPHSFLVCNDAGVNFERAARRETQAAQAAALPPCRTLSGGSPGSALRPFRSIVVKRLGVRPLGGRDDEVAIPRQQASGCLRAAPVPQAAPVEAAVPQRKRRRLLQQQGMTRGRLAAAGLVATSSRSSPESSDSEDHDLLRPRPRNAAPKPLARPVASASGQKPSRREDPALAGFASLPAAERLRRFWRFVVEACRGAASSNRFCREYEFGGILPFIGDVSAVLREIIIPLHCDLGEQLWRVMVVVWLGGGGPGFATYRHLVQGLPLQGEACPPEARLPELRDRARDVAGMYRHLERLADRHGRSAVLSGDGRSVQFRFERQQGLEVLRSWRRCVEDLVGMCGGTHEGLESLGTRRIYQHFVQYPWIGELTVKEIFCYLYHGHPRAVNVNEFVPVGSGAQRGAQLVLGLKQPRAADWHKELLNMIETIPEDLSIELNQAMRARLLTCDFGDDHRVPGVRQQLASGQPTAGDVEVCMCFFMNFLRAEHRGSAPQGWKMLERHRWSRPSMT